MNSTIIHQHRQRHGTWVTEEHVTDDGTVIHRTYFAAPETDTRAVLAVNAAAVAREHAARLVQAAEDAATEQRRVAAIRRLDVQDVADILGISREEAEERKRVKEVGRG